MPNKKLIDLDLLSVFKEKVTAYTDAGDAKAFKSASYADNVLSFFTTDDASGTAKATINLPEEMFLDQAKTKFVDNFTWSEESYPGSENPNLDGKPVLVLAVKGDKSVSYSFASLEKLIDVYTGENSASITTTVSGDNKIKAELKVSSTEGNIISIDENGVYASAEANLTFATEEEVSALWN